MHEFEEGFRYLDKLINSSEQLNSFLHANEEDCIAAIKNQNPICSTINIIKAKKKKQFFEIQKRQVLSTVHPLFKGLIPQQTQCVSIKENIQYISKILPDSDFDLSNIDTFIIEHCKNNYTITFTQASKWEKLELNHLRYYSFILEVKKSFDSVLQAIKYSKLFETNHEGLMNVYQRIKFEINQNFYEILKDYNIQMEDCKLMVKEEYNRIDYIITILVYLEKLIDSIDSRYENCIEKTFNVSSSKMRSSMLELQSRIEYIENALNYSIITKDLKLIVLNVLQDFKRNSLNTDINFKRYNYINVFTNYLEKLIQSFVHINQLTTNRFIEFLIEMNFNEYNFLNWISADLQEKGQKLTDTRSKIQFFMDLHTKYINFPIRVNSTFADSKIDLKTQLMTMCSKELNCLNYVGIIEKDKAPKVSQERIKIHLKKDASSMILLLQALNQTNLIDKMNKSDLARFISANFTSDKSEEFDMDGIRNRLYMKDPQTSKDLIIELKNIISILDKNLL
jgi:hypothetical protein